MDAQISKNIGRGSVEHVRILRIIARELSGSVVSMSMCECGFYIWLAINRLLVCIVISIMSLFCVVQFMECVFVCPFVNCRVSSRFLFYIVFDS